MKRSVSKYLSIILVYLVFSSLSQNVNAQWVQTNGPYGGAVNCFTVSGINIFAGTSGGGIFLSTNNGTNWVSVNNGLTNPYILDLTVTGTNIFAGTWGGGVFLSTNNGTSWNAVGLSSQSIKTLAILGANIFAGTNGSGVFLSTNNGTSWNAVGLSNQTVNSLAVSGTNIFAGTDGYGVFLSTNNGTSWTQTSLNSNYISSLAISGGYIFAGTWGGSGVFMSTNNGLNWINVNNGLTNQYDVPALCFSGTNLYAGTDVGIFLSTNHGTTWTSINNGLITLEVNVLSLSGTKLFAGTFSGVFLSTNNGTTWNVSNNGLSNQGVWALTVLGSNIFECGNGVFLSTNNGTNWAVTGLANQWVTSLAGSGLNLFAGTDAGVFLSTNNGTNWFAVNNGITNNVVRSLLISGINLYAGTDAGVFLSTNNGASWNGIGLSNQSVNALAVSETYIFAGVTGNGVFISTNNGISWNATGLISDNVLSLAISGPNVFAGTGNSGIFLSTNKGTNWVAVNNGLTDLGAASLSTLGTNIFAGTNVGIFLSTNNGTSWTNKNQGFYFAPGINAILIANYYIFVGTYGSSVWKRPLSDFFTLLPPLNLSYNEINNQLVWNLSPSSNVAKYLVYKKGSDNIWKSVADSGGIVNSNQNYYDIQTSGFNYYRVAAISNTGDTAKCDSVYVNRGYVLRRWDSNIIESFKVKKHGFSFANHDTLANGEPLLWNYSWYSRFYYQYPPYPSYLDFLFSKSADYPDWPLFTDVYGHDKCYKYYYKPGNILDSSFLKKSVAKWCNIKYYPISKENPLTYNWKGTCFGFSISSLLAFYKNPTFYSQFPIMNNVDSTYGLLPSTDIKKMINHLQQSQQFDGNSTLMRQVLPDGLENQTPVNVLNLLENKFSHTSITENLNEILGVFNVAGGGHAVVPFAIEKINDSIKYLYIYDNEHPAIDTARLIINTNTNSCIYNMNNNVIKRMFLVGSLESCLGEQYFYESSKVDYSKRLSINDFIRFFNATNSSSLYLNKFGDTISGFDITNNIFLGNKNLGFSLMTDGRVNPPIYYKIPYTGLIKVELKNFISSRHSSFLSFDFDSTTTYKIERTDSIQSNQVDTYFIDSSYFSFANNNPIQKQIYLLTITTENSEIKREKTFNIENYNMLLNDTVSIKKNNDNLIIKNLGTSKTYTLKLNLVDSSGNKSFYNPSVFIPPNSTHIISPTWDSIKTKPVKIFVDIGNNGTIDDTLFISDTTTTKITNTNNEIPNKFELYQNYPNPFNPRTKIKFDIPKATQISIRIYDILGREIECLVNEYVQPGKYSYDFNSNNLSSGVYFYRLQAGDYTNIKKMVLLK